MTIDKFAGDYRWLSNFHPCTIEFEGLEYPSTENAYQAAKTFDKNKRFAISLMTPSKAKSAGRGMLIRLDWEDVKIPIMRRLIGKKFRDDMLGALLVATGDQALIEGNYWHDNFWGACECAKCIQGPEQLNWLGKLLMEERTSLNVQAVMAQNGQPLIRS